MATAKHGGEGQKRKKGGLGKKLALSLAGLLAAAALLVGFAPTIAEQIVPDRVAAQSSAIEGNVGLASADLGWFGEQRFKGFTLTSAAGERIAEIDMTVSSGLFGLLVRGESLRRVTIGGRLEVIREADGTLNIETATKPTAPTPPTPATGPTVVPKQALGTDFVFENITVVYRDLAQPESHGPLEITADDFAGTVAIAADGTIDLDLAASPTVAGGTASLSGQGAIARMIDPSGVLSPSEAEATLEASLARLPTALLNRFLNGTGLKAERDIGETVDVQIAARTATEGARSAPFLPAELEVAANSQFATSNASLLIEPGRIRTRGDGARVSHASPAAVLAALAAGGDAHVRSIRGGRLDARLTNLDVPLAAGVDALSRIAADAQATLSDAAIEAFDERVEFKRLNTSVSLRPDVDPSMAFKLEGVTAGEPVTGEGTFRLVGGVAADRIRPIGSASINGLSAALADTFFDAIETPSGERVRLSELASLGGAERLDLSLETQSASDRTLSLNAEASGPALSATLEADVDPSDPMNPRIWSAQASSMLSPRAYDRLGSLFAPEAAPKLPKLREASEFRLSARRDGGSLTGELRLPDAAIDRYRFASPAGNGEIEIGPSSLRATLTARAAAAVLLDGAEGPIEMALTAAGNRVEGPAIGSIEAGAAAALRGRSLAGPVSYDATLEDLDVALADALFDEPRLASEAIGDRATVQVAGEADVASDGELRTATATARIEAPNLRTSRPIAVTVDGDRVRTTQPAEFAWEVEPAWINARMPSEDGGSRVTLSDARGILLELDGFSMPRSGGSLRDVSTSVTARVDRVSFAVPEGRDLRYRMARARFQTEAGSGDAAVSARMDAADGSEAFTLDGTITGLIDPQGVVTPETAVASLTAAVTAFPTPVLEALAGLDADLPTLLGPTVDASAELNGFPAAGGMIDLSAESRQASARFQGSIEQVAEGGGLRLVATGEPRAEIRELASAFEYNPARFLGLFAGFQKDPSRHEPAAATIRRLEAPLDGGIEGVVLDAMLDPGEVSFDIDGGLRALLNIAGQQAAGEAGEDLEPVELSMRGGVLRFKALKLPVGEFTFQSEGEVDLVQETERLTVNIPAGAFGAEFIRSRGRGLGIANDILGGTLNEDVMVPVRRSGPLGGDNEWKPDFKAVAEQLFDPRRIFEEGIRRGLEELLDGG